MCASARARRQVQRQLHPYDVCPREAIKTRKRPRPLLRARLRRPRARGDAPRDGARPVRAPSRLSLSCPVAARSPPSRYIITRPLDSLPTRPGASAPALREREARARASCALSPVPAPPRGSTEAQKHRRASHAHLCKARPRCHLPAHSAHLTLTQSYCTQAPQYVGLSLLLQGTRRTCAESTPPWLLALGLAHLRSYTHAASLSTPPGAMAASCRSTSCAVVIDVPHPRQRSAVVGGRR